MVATRAMARTADPDCLAVPTQSQNDESLERGKHAESFSDHDDHQPTKQSRKRKAKPAIKAEASMSTQKQMKVKTEPFDDDYTPHNTGSNLTIGHDVPKEQEKAYLDITADMRRPPGEKKAPRIYPIVPKGKRILKPKTDTVTAWPDPRIKVIKPLKNDQVEVRARQTVDEASEWNHEALSRATKGRMFVIERIRGFETKCHAHHDDCPTETIRIAGSTGNVYTVYISHLPSCTCRDYFHRKRQCKHISYILNNVLKAPQHLCIQDALLTTELKQIAATAPPIPTVIKPVEEAGNKRKPLDDDCPICCMNFEAGEDVVWCQASCGNNVHQACFNEWSRVLKQQHRTVTCPFCRTVWDKGAIDPIQKMASDVMLPAYRTADGYINVRDQLAYD